HRQPMAVGLQPPVQEEFRLVLLPRDQPDDALVEARGNGFGFDVADEPVLVVAGRELLDRVGFGFHTGPPICVVPFTRRTSGRSMCGVANSDRGILSSASSTATLIRFQLACTGHEPSCSQAPGLKEHSVMPNGPSSAWMTSPMLMWSAVAARRYPP